MNQQAVVNRVPHIQSPAGGRSGFPVDALMRYGKPLGYLTTVSMGVGVSPQVSVNHADRHALRVPQSVVNYGDANVGGAINDRRDLMQSSVSTGANRSDVQSFPIASRGKPKHVAKYGGKSSWSDYLVQLEIGLLAGMEIRKQWN